GATRVPPSSPRPDSRRPSLPRRRSRPSPAESHVSLARSAESWFQFYLGVKQESHPDPAVVWRDRTGLLISLDSMPFKELLRGLPKRLERLVLRRMHIEDSQQLRHLQQIADALGQIRQLNRGPGIVRRRMQRHERAQPARIDIVDLTQVQNNPLRPVL